MKYNCLEVLLFLVSPCGTHCRQLCDPSLTLTQLCALLNTVLSCMAYNTLPYTHLYIYILDAVPPIHIVWNRVATDKLTTANGETFTSSLATFSSQWC